MRNLTKNGSNLRVLAWAVADFPDPGPRMARKQAPGDSPKPQNAVPGGPESSGRRGGVFRTCPEDVPRPEMRPAGTPKTAHFPKETFGFSFLAHPWNFSVAEVLEDPPRTPRACPGEPEGVDMGPPGDLKNLFIP